MASIYFVVALMPELGFDALAMHLFIPVSLFFNHKWNYDVQTYVWAVMPMLADWIFSWGYMLGGEICSRLLNFGFIILIAFLIKSICLWAGGTKNSSKWAILLYLSTPLTFAVGSTLFIEPVWSAFLIAGIYLILKVTFDEDKAGSAIRFSGLLLGFALASKAITLSILPILLAILLIGYKSWLRYKFAKNVILGLFIFMTIGCIPYLLTYIITGNRLFPLFNDILKSPVCGICMSSSFTNRKIYPAI
jgi:4-amino-4-deoxy-L-arabinose transferase-like glycosyltransferase